MKSLEYVLLHSTDFTTFIACKMITFIENISYGTWAPLPPGTIIWATFYCSAINILATFYFAIFAISICFWIVAPFNIFLVVSPVASAIGTIIAWACIRNYIIKYLSNHEIIIIEQLDSTHRKSSLIQKLPHKPHDLGHILRMSSDVSHRLLIEGWFLQTDWSWQKW